MSKPRPVKFVWAEKILESEFTTHGRVRALLCVGTYMDPPGDSCFPSERRVADDFPVSRDTVHGALVDAAAAGWLLWRPRTFSDGTQLPSQRGRSEFEYQATFPDGHPAWDRISEADTERMKRRATRWASEVEVWRRGRDPVVGDPDHHPPEAAETSVVGDPDHQSREAAETSVVRDSATPAGGMKQRPPVVGTGGGAGTRTVPPDPQEPAETQDGQTFPLAIDHDHMDQATFHDVSNTRDTRDTREATEADADVRLFYCERGCGGQVGGPNVVCASCRASEASP